MIPLAIVAGFLLVIPIVDVLTRSDLRRVALRNALRRPGEAALVVLGSALGTAIIAAAFIVGDTFDYSIRDIARTRLGPIDQRVILANGADLESAFAALNAAPPKGTDGILAARVIQAAVANTDSDGDIDLAEPNVTVAALDLDQALAFGGDVSITGLASANTPPADGEAIINRQIANEIGAEVGHRLLVYAYGKELPITVLAIVPTTGIAGQTDVIVQPGTLLALSANSAGTEPTGLILVSNRGGVFDATPRPDIETATGSVLRDANVLYDQGSVKADLLDNAEEEGAEITEIFIVVGGFSVLAGIVLLINLFVMLAEERKPTLGVLRAVGWRRQTLVRSFALEGAIYALLAAVIGAIAGIGVGWAVVQVTQDIFSSGDRDFVILLDVVPRSLITAGLIGLVISLLSIWLTSMRIARLNIITAIRDLPEGPSARRRWIVAATGSLLGLVGIGLMVLGIAQETVIPALLGPALALLGIGLVLRDRVPGEPLALIIGAAVILWGSLALQVLPDAMTSNIEIPVFLVLGIVLVGGGVAMVSVAGPWTYRLLQRLPGTHTVGQLGLAYPVARRFRTAASLAMFSLVIFSLTFIAILVGIFGNEGKVLTRELSAGRQILVRSNHANPLPEGALEEVPGVLDATSLVRAFPRFSGSYVAAGNSGSAADPDSWGVSGIGPDFAAGGAVVLRGRLPRFASDRDVFAAVATDPTLTVVPWWFLEDDGREVALGDTITMHTPDDETHDFTVAGITGDDFLFAGAWLQDDLVEQLLPERSHRSRYYVSVADDADPADVARLITSTYLVNGADAASIRDEIDEFVARQTGFFNLLAGYLSLGLVIGIAGLAVVLVRAVRERRREIGMLRAMGMRAGGIRQIFVIEAAFVALLGILTGIALGSVVAYQVLTNSDAFGGTTRDFAMPWTVIAVIVLVPLIASAIAAFIPAVRAGRIHPSEALRLSD